MLLFWVILTVTLMVGISAIMVKQEELFWAKNLVGPLTSSYILGMSSSPSDSGAMLWPLPPSRGQTGSSQQNREEARSEQFLILDTADNCAALFFVVSGEEGCPVSCRMPGSIPALCPLGASSNLSRDNQMCLQTLPNVSWGWGRQIE